MNFISKVGASTPSPELKHAAREYSGSAAEERGAIFTRYEIVEFILDLVGYTEASSLAEMRLLEPSAGQGDFLLPAVRRLVRSYHAGGGSLANAHIALAAAIVAHEVHEESLQTAKAMVATELINLGLSRQQAESLASQWLVLGDFLLAQHSADYTHVVGNPPYVRQELIPEALLSEYRRRYVTLYDRADLYVPFFERSLSLLAPGGRLGFICTDRWTKNKYGGPLRAMVARGFALTHYVDLVNTPAFLSDVMTYPAITVIERQTKRDVAVTRVAYRPRIDASTLLALAKDMTADKVRVESAVALMSNVVNGSEPWIVHEPDRLALVRRLEEALPTLEKAGCKVGIGVATGNDGVYIQPFDELDVEPSRKLPIVRTQDIFGGTVKWQGMGVLNPFEDDGSVVQLDRYPRFAAYLDRHAAAVKARNVAARNPNRWFRTIDRIYPELAARSKLLIPDIKGDAHVVYEEGKLYPHHNLYYIVSESWDLHALQAVLMSGIARLFVATYSTTMRGGSLRFQAQYLRRIRVPEWSNVPSHLRHALTSAAKHFDRKAADAAMIELYGLSQAEAAIVIRA